MAVSRIVWGAVLIALLYPAKSAFTLNLHYSLDSIKIEARPGQYVTRTVHIGLPVNEKPAHIRAHAEDYWVSEDGRQSFYREPGGTDAPKRSCATWVRVNPVEAALQPGDDLTIKISVAVPEGTAPGGYWCAFTMDEVPDPLAKQPGTGLRFLTSFSTGVFVSVPPVERAAAITGVDVGPDEVVVRVRNDGNGPIGAQGYVDFVPVNGSGGPIRVIVPRGGVFPEPIRTRALYAPLPNAQSLPSGRYRMRVVMDVGLDHYVGVEKEMDLKRDSMPVSEKK
jgi:hypothetical protein